MHYPCTPKRWSLLWRKIWQGIPQVIRDFIQKRQICSFLLALTYLQGTPLPLLSADEASIVPSLRDENIETLAPEETSGRTLSLDEAYRLAFANEEQIKIAERELA